MDEVEGQSEASEMLGLTVGGACVFSGMFLIMVAGMFVGSGGFEILLCLLAGTSFAFGAYILWPFCHISKADERGHV